MLYSVGRVCLVIVGSLVLAGCGGGPKKVAVFKATGTVTFQGKPLPQASVTFSPVDDGQTAVPGVTNDKPVAYGMTDDKGEFTLTTYTAGDGAPAGSYNVVVSKAVPTGAASDAAHSADPAVLAKAQAGHDAASSATTGSVIPITYSDANKTPLTAKVDPKAENKFTFEIKE